MNGVSLPPFASAPPKRAFVKRHSVASLNRAAAEGHYFPMSFFAATHPAQGRTFGSRSASAGSALGVSLTTHPLDASVRGLRGFVPQSTNPKRAGPGDFFDVEKNAGGREPPGRNTRRRT
jgi:hypothetical protein